MGARLSLRFIDFAVFSMGCMVFCCAIAAKWRKNYVIVLTKQLQVNKKVVHQWCTVLPYFSPWCTVRGVPLLFWSLRPLATIIPRTRKDGSTSYRVQITIKKKGQILWRESETFSKKSDAKRWATKREARLAEPNAIEQLRREKNGETIAGLIELYEEKVGKIKTWERSKQQVLNAWKNREEGKASVFDVNSAWLIDYCIKRSSEDKAGPATINADIAILRSVFSVAKDVLGVPVSVMPFVDARPTLNKLKLVSKSNERDRRPQYDEISKIVELGYLARKSKRGKGRRYAPIDKVIVFQMFSARRISETCRLLWEDVNEKDQTVLVRDMKDPGRKQGNDVRVLVPDEAWAVLQSMPKVEPRIFPYDSRSLEAAYQTRRMESGFYERDSDNNLRLHDLRHEALSWLAEKNGLAGENWDIPRLQLVSGHKNWNVLQRYVNLLQKEPVDRWKDWEWKERVLT